MISGAIGVGGGGDFAVAGFIYNVHFYMRRFGADVARLEIVGIAKVGDFLVFFWVRHEIVKHIGGAAANNVWICTGKAEYSSNKSVTAGTNADPLLAIAG